MQHSLINVFAVEWYGECEFWLATGKIALLAMVFCFTFITSKQLLDTILTPSRRNTSPLWPSLKELVTLVV